MHLSSLVFSVLCVNVVICAEFEYNIGKLFENGEKEVEVFNWIIERVNSYLQRRDSYQLTPLSVHIEPENSLLAFLETCNLLQNGVVAIFGSEYDENSGAIHSVCDTKEIPLIETRWNSNPTRGTLINLYPHAPAFSKALADIVRAWEWRTFTIIYEDNDSVVRVKDLLQMMEVKKFYPVMLQQLDRGKTGVFRDALKEVKKSGQKHLIVDCSLPTLKEVLHQAQQVGLMTQEYSYIITNPDFLTLDLEEYKYSEANITGVSMISPENNRLAQDLARYLNVSSPLEIDLSYALLVDAVYLFKSAFELARKATNFEVAKLDCDTSDYWVFGYSITNYMKTMTMQGITGLIKFDNEGFRSEFKLDIYEVGEEDLLKVGEWNYTEGITVKRPKTEIYVPEESLVNRTFIVITAMTDPYGMHTESDVQLFGNDRYEGFGIDLIKEMAALEGFNYTFIIREDKANGKKDEATGEWSGMIGDVMKGKADLAITDLTITSERQEAVDFTSTFMNLGISILYKKPGKAPPSFFSFAEPFALDVWLTLGVAYFGVSIILFIIGRLCPDEWTNPYPCIEEPEYLINQFTLRNSFWFTIGSLMQQGTEIAPIAISTRMVAGLWWFFTLIMVSSYTANLAAFLTTENPDSPFNNVKELVENAEKYGIKYGAKLNGATANFFRDSNDSLYNQIYAYMEKNKDDVMVGENKIGVSKAINESYAFFMESTSIEYEIQRHCELTQVGDLLDEKSYGIAMRKNSSYRKALSTAILKLHASGKIGELKRKWWEERKGGGQCPKETAPEGATPLSMRNVEGVFYVTIGGIALAGVLVFFEMVMHIFKESLRNKTSWKEAFKHEMQFYLNFDEMVKPVIQRNSRSKSKSSKSKSTDREIEENGERDPPAFGFVLPDNVEKN